MSTLEDVILHLKKGALLVGVGNDMSGDDAFGPILARRLKSALGEKAMDTGLAPENWIGPIRKLNPKILIIADAVAFDGKPGEVRVFQCCELGDSLPTTHGPGLGAFIGYLQEILPEIEIFILAVQPERTGFGKAMSDAVAEAIEKIAKRLE